MKWINQLLPIIEEYRDGGEPLNGDEVDGLCSIIKAKINLQEGNITEAEYDRILDGEPVPELPDGLQKYIDGVALNILYSNYHKSTNGIWSRAEVVDHGTFEPNFGIETEKEYWEVGVSYGKADDCGSEDYYDKIYVWKVSDSGLQVVTEDYKPVDFAWRYNLEETK
jgi:hypothetical protein